LISAFCIAVILLDFGQKGNARLGCGDGEEKTLKFEINNLGFPR
jgi:hypothetical protein